MRIPEKMNFRSLRAVYMGTPEFAVAPLQKLLNAGCNLIAVITVPDKPAGRGKKIRFSAVKEFALVIVAMTTGSILHNCFAVLFLCNLH